MTLLFLTASLIGGCHPPAERTLPERDLAPTEVVPAPEAQTTPAEPSPARSSAPLAIVMPATTNRAALFSDELASLRAAVWAWLSSRRSAGLAVQPLETYDELQGPTCAAPPGMLDVLRARFPGAWLVDTTAHCDEGQPCRLAVRVHRPPAEGAGAWETLHRWNAEVVAPRSVSAWIEAVPQLTARPASSGAGGVVGISDDESPALVDIDWTQARGSWRQPPEPSSFQTVQGHLDACHAPGWSSASTEHGVLAYDAEGRVTRCELGLDREPKQTRSECLCEALRQHRVAPGAADRRIELGFVNRPTSAAHVGDRAVHARFEMVRVTGGFRAYPGFGAVKRALAECYAEAGILAPTRVPLRVVVDGRGRVRDLALGEGPPETRTCTLAALRRMAFTCPAEGAEATWEGELATHAAPSTGPD